MKARPSLAPWHSLALAGMALPGVAAAEEIVVPARVVEGIVIDGALDEADWENAAQLRDWKGHEPMQGVDAPPTTVQILVDEEHIYFGFTAAALPGTPLSGALVPRDGTRGHDWVGVMLDTFADERRAFVFRANPRGVQADGVFTQGGHVWMMGLAWDGVYRSAGKMTDEGYTVELAIPFRTLRYPNTPTQTWGFTAVRFTPLPWSTYTWPRIDKEQAGVLTQAATLGPFAAPTPKAHVEVLPTLTAHSGELTEGVAPTADPGMGLKWSPSSALVLDLALNPDFSQIEADEEQVTANLKYPLRLKEKRPFFLESGDLFETPLGVFYSRAIVDPLVAQKITGRVGKTAFGLLGAWDQTPAASSIGVDYATGDARPSWDAETVDGATAWTSGLRLQRDLGGGNSVGLLSTDKRLLTSAGPTLANTVTGLDGSRRLGERHTLEGQLLGSLTELATGEDLQAAAWKLKLKRAGRRFNGELRHGHIGEDFRAETGFLEEVGRTHFGADGTLRMEDVGPARFVAPGLRSNIKLDPSGATVGADLAVTGDLMFGDKDFSMHRIGVAREKYLGETFDTWSHNSFAIYKINPKLRFMLDTTLGPEPHYAAASADDLYLGFGSTLWARMEANAFERLDIGWSTIYGTFHDDFGGNLIYETWIHSLDLNHSFSQSTSLRLIEQWNGWTGAVDSSLLLAWQRDHGTAAYLGYNETRTTESGEVSSQGIFAKVGWLFRP